jgi:DNA adenine methylase
MVYVGGKQKTAKEIVPIVTRNRKPGQWYVEPFCGGCNTLCMVDGNRIANDANKYLIAMWKKLLEGWQPGHVTEQDYKMMRQMKEVLPAHLVGWTGFIHSYRSIFFGGYNSPITLRAHRNNIAAQLPALQGVKFHSGSYDAFPIPKKSIIYCDPPYATTTEYHDDEFDHDKFWEWVRKMSREGHEVYVSEYTAPADFISIWGKTRVTGLGNKSNRGKYQTEKLFVYKPTYNGPVK